MILAAGAGTRLGSGHGRLPKPLTPVFGTPLLTRALRSACSAGLEHVVVVVGYRAHEVGAHAAAAASELDLELTIAPNPHWTAGNGASLLAAEPFVDDRCVVLMADHMVPPSFLRLLIDAPEDGAAGQLLVDPDPDNVHDLEEATRVRLRGDRIAAIGKHLDPFDAVDTGVFRFDRRIFEALREEIARGHSELSAAVQRLADDGLMHAVPSDGSFWCDVDTPEDLAFVRRRPEGDFLREFSLTRDHPRDLQAAAGD